MNTLDIDMGMDRIIEINTQAKIYKKEKRKQLLNNQANRKQESMGCQTESILHRQIQQVPMKNQEDSHQGNHQLSSRQSQKLLFDKIKNRTNLQEIILNLLKS